MAVDFVAADSDYDPTVAASQPLATSSTSRPPSTGDASSSSPAVSSGGDSLSLSGSPVSGSSSVTASGDDADRKPKRTEDAQAASSRDRIDSPGQQTAALANYAVLGGIQPPPMQLASAGSDTVAGAAGVSGAKAAPALASAPAPNAYARPATAPTGENTGTSANTSSAQKPPSDRTVSPDRAKAIDAWADKNVNPGALSALWSGSGSSRVASALQGKDPTLGNMTPAEQQHLLDRSLDAWQHTGDANAIASLGDSLQGKGAVADLASRSFASRAAQVATAAGPASDMYKSGVASQDRNVSGALAVSAVKDAASTQALGRTVRGLGPSGAGAFADALTMQNDPASLAKSLNAVNAGPNDATATSFTSHVLASDKGFNFSNYSYGEAGATRLGASEAAAPMGTALSRMVHPNDPVAASRDAERMSGLVGGAQGSQLLAPDFGNDKVSTTDRFRALAAIANNPQITEQSLAKTGGSPWANPALAATMAQQPANAMLRTSGDASVPLAGADLDKTVAAAMPGANRDDVATVTSAIRSAAGNGQTPKVAVLPVQSSNGDYGPTQSSLFRVDNGAGSKFVDSEGRTYGSFQQWKDENRLPSGNMTYPAGGHLTADAQGNARLESSNTPATPDTFGKQVVAGAKATVPWVGAAAGVAVMAGGGWVPATVLGGASLFMAGSEAQHLSDMNAHGQSLDPTKSSEARSAWLGLLANGAVGVGTAAKVGSAALGTTERLGAALGTTSSVANGAGAGLSVLAGANQTVADAQNWSRMTPQQRLMAGVNLGFTVASAGAAGKGLVDNFSSPRPGVAGAEPVAGAQPPKAPAAVDESRMVPQQSQLQQARDLRGAPAPGSTVEITSRQAWLKTCRDPQPNTTYHAAWKSPAGDVDATVTTDAKGRTTSVTGTLLDGPSGPRLGSDANVSKFDGAKPTDVGFHTVAHARGGLPGRLTVLPGDGQLNITTYAALERQMKTSAPAGSKMTVEAVYETGNATERPDAFRVTVKDPSGKTILKQSFDNQ